MDDPNSQYLQHLRTTVSGGCQTTLLCVGYKLKLFDHLGEENEPRTSTEIAELANLKERYVREWLNGMVIGRFVQCDPTGKTYWLPKGAKDVLKTSGQVQFVLSAYVQLYSLVFDQITECFKPDGPRGMPYSAYGTIHELIGTHTDLAHNATLLQYLIPSIPGLQEELERGITCLDVGCGTGTVSILMASRFPKSQFYAIDLFEDVIDACIDRAREKGLSNVHFVVADAKQLPSDWTSKFEYATTFDVIHDVPRGDLVLREIIRVLKPNGRYSMLDIYADSNVCENIGDPKASFTYLASLFHCMPVSLYYPDGLGLGTMWGKQKATALLKEAGFAKVELLGTPWDKENFNAHFLCTKMEQAGL